MVEATVIQVGDLEIDLVSRLVRKAGQAVSLSRQQRALLEMLVRNANQTLTHQQLLQEIWGDSYDDTSRYILHNAIKRLREKIGDSYIVAESNIGYRLDTKHPAPEPSAATPVPATASTPALYVPSRTFTNLPSQRTSFVGRSGEKQAIRDLLMHPDVRLITLTGPGGTGKTRLALEVASSLVDTFTNGTVFVPLAAVTEPQMVLRALAQALSIKEKAGDQPLATIVNTIHDKHLLLILDNFEQIVAAVPYISELLDGCPSIKILVTSRAVLQLYGEHEYLVPPLALPNQHDSYPLDVLASFEAIALFVERARAGNRLFQLTRENAEAVISICTRLDGLPLAIELVTARVKYQSPQALWDRLQTNTALSLLTNGPRDLGARQQTLRAAIAWSYDLLAPEEQQLFNRIAVFADGYSIEAVEWVCDVSGDLLLQAFDGMVALMDKSLIHFQQDSEGNTRFAMLQTIREFAQEQLTTSGEQELLIQRHAAYYFDLVEPGAAGSGVEEIVWLNRLELEHDNVRQALHWFIQSGDSESALKMCNAVWSFWYTRGYFREGRQWFAEAFGTSTLVTDETVSKARYAEGIFGVALGLYDSAMGSFQQAQSIWEAKQDVLGLARIFHSIGRIHMHRNEFDDAMKLFEKALHMSSETDNFLGVVSALHNIALILCDRGAYDEAIVKLKNVLCITKDNDDVYGVIMALAALGSAFYLKKDYASATQYYKESLQANLKFNDQYALLVCIEGLAWVAYDTERFQVAASLLGAFTRRSEQIGQSSNDSNSHEEQQQKIIAAEERFGEQWVSWYTEGMHLRVECVMQLIESHL